jgi:hypothetical protein
MRGHPVQRDLRTPQPRSSIGVSVGNGAEVKMKSQEYVRLGEYGIVMICVPATTVLSYVPPLGRGDREQRPT